MTVALRVFMTTTSQLIVSFIVNSAIVALTLLARLESAGSTAHAPRGTLYKDPDGQATPSSAARYTTMMPKTYLCFFALVGAVVSTGMTFYTALTTRLSLHGSVLMYLHSMPWV